MKIRTGSGKVWKGEMESRREEARKWKSPSLLTPTLPLPFYSSTSLLPPSTPPSCIPLPSSTSSILYHSHLPTPLFSKPTFLHLLLSSFPPPLPSSTSFILQTYLPPPPPLLFSSTYILSIQEENFSLYTFIYML